MKKILFVGQFPPPVTGEAIANNIVLESILIRNSVRVVDSSLIVDADDVGVLRFEKIIKLLSVFLRYAFYLPGCDTVYITPGQTKFGVLRSALFIVLAKVLNKKIVSHWHGYGALSIQGVFRFFCRICLSMSSKNIVLTRDALSKLVSSYRLPEKKFIEINNFCDNFDIDVLNRNERLKVIFLGSLMPEKGIEEFLTVCSTLHDVDFYICGAGSKLIREKCELLQQNNPNVHYLGVVSGHEKYALLKTMDLFVLQTYYLTEGVPLSMLEAMACGCAVLTTKHNGIPEVVGEIPVWLDKKSPESLMNSLKFFDLNRDVLLEEKKRLYCRSKDFTIQSFRDSVTKLIES